MTTQKKASEALSKLEELESTTVVNIVNEYLTDEELADIYDKLEEEQ